MLWDASISFYAYFVMQGSETILFTSDGSLDWNIRPEYDGDDTRRKRDESIDLSHFIPVANFNQSTCAAKSRAYRYTMCHLCHLDRPYFISTALCHSLQYLQRADDVGAIRVQIDCIYAFCDVGSLVCTSEWCERMTANFFWKKTFKFHTLPSQDVSS